MGGLTYGDDRGMDVPLGKRGCLPGAQVPPGVAGADDCPQTCPVQNTNVGEVAWMFWILLVLLLVSRAAFVVSVVVLLVAALQACNAQLLSSSLHLLTVRSLAPYQTQTDPCHAGAQPLQRQQADDAGDGHHLVGGPHARRGVRWAGLKLGRGGCGEGWGGH